MSANRIRLMVALAAVLASVSASGCTLEPTLSVPHAAAPTGEVRAGAATADITPLPGFPLAGHAVEGGTSVGVWTRLRARAIYIEDAQGVPTVLVSCDLWAMPAGLADRVAQLVHERGLVHVGREHLLIAATHTHHSPGHFSTARVYNAMAAPGLGYDPELFEFLADRIAGAIVEAATDPRPAKLSTSRRRPNRMVYNRSPLPFSANPEACEILAGNTDLDSCERSMDRVDRCRAVYPVLTVLRIDDRDHPQAAPIAVAAFYATHPTVMTDQVDVYQADMFGVAAHHVGRALARDGVEPVVALFNGAEGDVSPQWRVHGRPETVRLGHGLGSEVVAGASGELEAFELDRTEHRFQRVGLKQRAAFHAGEHDETGRIPVAGASLTGGATDGRTGWYRPPPGKTVNRERFRGHGRKKPYLPIAMQLLYGGPGVPSEVPLSIHRIGRLRLVGVPGEFTTTLGVRIRERVGARAPDDVIVVGLADEYLSYFTTPEEYAHQHYEGSSTLWGTHAGTVVVDDLGRLEHAHPPPSGEEHRVYHPGHRRHLALRPGGRAHGLTKAAAPRLDRQLEVGRRTRFELTTAPAQWGQGTTMPALVLEQEVGGAWVPAIRGALGNIDHEGEEFVTVVTRVRRKQWTWAVSWIGDPVPGATLRIRATKIDGSTHACSAAFSGTSPPDDVGAAPC